MGGKFDEESLFLLPFQEKAEYTLRRPISKPGSPPKRQRRASKDSENADQTMYYEACDLKRTSSELLETATCGSDPSTVFRILCGQFVLLRPHDNSYRPSIAKVISIQRQPSESHSLGYVRLQWFYRGEDLNDEPAEAVGEDEVFETHHYDTIEVECIAGRCSLTSYTDWLSAASKESQRLHDAVRDSAKSQATDSQTDRAPARAKTKARSNSNAVPSRDANGVVQNPQRVRIGYDSDEDARTSFRENYCDSAIRYYCRHFYDPLMHIFVNTSIECDGADPQHEIAIRRGLEGRIADDDEFDGENLSEPESESEAEDIDEEELQSLQSRGDGPKRRGKTSRSTTPGVKRRVGSRANRSSQFALPVQLGNVDKLPCRDEQKAHVRSFLLEMIGDPDGSSNQGSRCLYISGVPGTGKTATVREVLQELRGKLAAGEVTQFEIVEVNAMSLPDPALVYSELYAAVTGKRGVAPMHAAQLLEKRFSDVGQIVTPSKQKGRGRGKGSGGGASRAEGDKQGCVIVMLDEMDVLLARKQKVLYDLLEWPSRRNARLAIIGIANTMDLPERMLPRLASRIGLNRLCYPPYSSTQITEILKLTLPDCEAGYEESAIRLCATKVGAVSGDVRRAFELCRRATEFRTERCGAESAAKVTAVDVHKAIQAVAGNARLAALGQLALFEKVALVSALHIARSEGSFGMENMCSMEAVCEKGLEFVRADTKRTFAGCEPTTFELQEACWRLAGQRIVLIEKAIVPRLSRVIVNLSADDCAFGLRECEFCTAILSGQLGIKS